jgi:hypothetical protein|tara:strand:- start:1270 stop:1422 length:153 start_codon:yes stop_codon:yes gene_type:complete
VKGYTLDQLEGFQRAIETRDRRRRHDAILAAAAARAKPNRLKGILQELSK